MTKLRLGRIENEKPIKLTIELSGGVHRDLCRYADAQSRETGIEHPLAVERLIPPMIERFMASDRAFVRRRRPAAD